MYNGRATSEKPINLQLFGWAPLKTESSTYGAHLNKCDEWLVSGFFTCFSRLA